MSTPPEDQGPEPGPCGPAYNDHYKGLQVGSYTDQKLVRLICGPPPFAPVPD